MMDQEKTKNQLISKLEERRQCIHDLEPVEAEGALKDCEAQLRRVQKVANMGFFKWNLATDEIELSDQIIEMFGLDPGKTWTTPDLVAQMTHPEDMDYVRENLELAVKGEKKYDIDHRIVRSDGEVLWVHARADIKYDEQDNSVQLLGSVVDITKRKQIENKLQNRIHNIDERVKELNCLYGISKLIETSDMSLEKIIRGTIALIPPAWQYPEITCARAVVDGQKFEIVPFRETSWKQCSKIKIYGKTAGVLEVYYLEERPEIHEGPFLKEERKLIDAIAERLGRIIERKRAEVALSESEAKFRILSEHSQLGIAIIQNGLFIYANIAFSDIVGCSTEEIRLWKTGDFTRLTDPAFSLEQEQEEISRLIQINTRGGEVKWIEFYANNIRHRSKKTEMITIIDITERKKAEEKVRQQQQQLIQLDKLASLGALVAGVAHEINNPNQTIMSNANRISEAWKSIGPILEEYYEENGDFLVGGLNYSRMRKQMPVYQRGISEGAKSIDLIVNDLKNFARQENYEKHEEININRVVNASVTLASDYIKKATNRLTIEIEKNLPTIKGNFQRLEQVMINLIQNACQALQDNERGILITTSFAADRNFVEVKVRDEGVGIAPENLTRIKDPFFTTKRDAGGMGLGLSISATIIEDHQGSLTIASERGKGTTATICLPVIPGESRPRAKQDP